MSNPISNLAADLRQLAEQLDDVAMAYEKAVVANNDADKHFHIGATLQGLDEVVHQHRLNLGAIEADIENDNQIKVMVASIEAAAPRDLTVHIGPMEHGKVRIDYTLASGDEIRRMFTCPPNGGEISEIRHDGKLVPAYAYLTEGGARATCETQDNLPQALHVQLLGTVDDDRITMDGQSLDYDYGLSL